MNDPYTKPLTPVQKAIMPEIGAVRSEYAHFPHCRTYGSSSSSSRTSHRLPSRRHNFNPCETSSQQEASPALRSCLKVVSHCDDDSTATPQASSFNHARILTESHAQPKSVHISEPLPRRDEGLHRTSSCRSMKVSGGTPKPSRHRRITSEVSSFTTHSLIAPPPQETSPSLSSSTCESEEDATALETPVDDHRMAYRHDSHASDTFSDYCAPSERTQQPSSDSLSDMAIPLAQRTPLRPGTEGERALRQATAQQRPALRSRPSIVPQSVPTYSTSFEARAKPIPFAGKTHSSCIPGISRVVTTGLELGLGLATGPHTSFTSRSLEGMVFDRLAVTSPGTGISTSPYHSIRGGTGSERDEVRTEPQARDDQAELHRRRTTGGLHANDGMVGKKRIHRTGTQDPHGRRGDDADEHAAHGSGSNTTSSSPVAGGDRTFGSFSTPMDTPSHDHRATLSPHIGADNELSSNDSQADMRVDHYSRTLIDVRDRTMAPDARLDRADRSLAGGLMGVGEIGHFGPGVRAKVAEVLQAVVPTLPLTFDEEEGETVNMAEYGSSRSRSALLFQPVISMLARQSVAGASDSSNLSTTEDDHLFLNPAQSTCKLSFCISHEDVPPSDFRSTMQMLESHPESYMDRHWQANHVPGLVDAVFPSFSVRPFAARLAPSGSMHLGFSLMDMHWTHAPVPTSTNRNAAAQAELTAFLRSRAKEFKKDGVLVLAYIARREGGKTTSSGASSSVQPLSSDSAVVGEGNHCPGGKDIWMTLRDVLAPCIQRLVSCGMLKSDVARHLLELPLIPRTAEQTRAALDTVKQDWKLEWSCGLQEEGEGEGQCSLPSERSLLRLPHPACKAYESGCLSRVAFTEHVIQLFKTLYEAHFRSTLREKGRLSKGAVEFVLDSLWDALFSRIVDQQPAIVRDVEIEVCVYALRRR